jgi:hypothetical protein
MHPKLMRDKVAVGSAIRAKMAEQVRRLASQGVVQSCALKEE